MNKPFSLPATLVVALSTAIGSVILGAFIVTSLASTGIAEQGVLDLTAGAAKDPVTHDPSLVYVPGATVASECTQMRTRPTRDSHIPSVNWSTCADDDGDQVNVC